MVLVRPLRLADADLPLRLAAAFFRAGSSSSESAGTVARMRDMAVASKARMVVLVTF